MSLPFSQKKKKKMKGNWGWLWGLKEYWPLLVVNEENGKVCDQQPGYRSCTKHCYAAHREIYLTGLSRDGIKIKMLTRKID